VTARPRRRALALAATGLLLLAGCSHAPHPAPAPEAPPAEFGEASYYGPEFEGRKTASGERYHGDALTAAHRTLPFGTRVRVTDLSNGRTVDVVVNDRGPHRRGRIVDLSRSAAEQLHMVGRGVAQVRVEVID
jgi:peptidoglycan lytic transglycosylase